MGQSLVNQYTHIIFSTKYQKPLIIDSVEEELYRYIGGICPNMECYPVKIGGYRNHVHILCLLSKKIALMKLLEKIKLISTICFPKTCNIAGVEKSSIVSSVATLLRQLLMILSGALLVRISGILFMIINMANHDYFSIQIFSF